MATSGSFKTSGYNGRHLVFSWTETSQSTENNTTTISWTLKGAGTAPVGYYMTGNIKLVIDGTTVYSRGRNDRFELYNGTSVASGTHTLTHDDEGNKSFTVSAQAGIYAFGVNCTGSATFTLDNIARASQPSLITWPETTNDVGNFGATISIHMNSNSDAFTHTVRYAFGSKSGTCINEETGKPATGIATGIRWKIPEDWMNLLPASTSGSGLIYVDTYNGSTLIGTKYTGFTATVPASVKPSCTFTLDDITNADDIYGSHVKGLSKITVEVTPKTAYSSPIDAITVEANGVKYSGSPVTTAALTKSGTSRVTVTVRDERGRTGTSDYDMTVQDYAAPAVTALAVHRCDADGTTDDRGDYVKVTFSAAVSPMSNKNTASYTLKYKKSSATSWTSVPLSALANKYSVTNYEYILAADGNSAYDISVTAADRHNAVPKSTSASTAFTLMNFHASGTALRFGGVAQEENTLANDLHLEQRGNRYAFSSPGTAGAEGFVHMARIVVTAANADTPITFVLTRRKAQTPMTVHVTLQNSTADTSSVASVLYEGANYGAFIAQGGDALTWDLYVQKGTAYDTITLQDWWTSKTMQSRVEVSFPGQLVSAVPSPYWRATPAVLQSAMDYLMPVGFVLTLYSHADPNEMYPGTTWVRIENAFLWAIDSVGRIGVTGGEKTVTLTTAQLPAHSHGSVYSQHASGTKDKAWYNTSGSSVAYGAVETGGGQAHNNMPPFVQVSIWRRTA